MTVLRRLPKEAPSAGVDSQSTVNVNPKQWVLPLAPANFICQAVCAVSRKEIAPVANTGMTETENIIKNVMVHTSNHTSYRFGRSASAAFGETCVRRAKAGEATARARCWYSNMAALP